MQDCQLLKHLKHHKHLNNLYRLYNCLWLVCFTEIGAHIDRVKSIH